MACAEYEVGIREQSPDSRSSLAILPMYDPGMLASLIAGVKVPSTAEGRDDHEVDGRAPAYVDSTRHQYGT